MLIFIRGVIDIDFVQEIDNVAARVVLIEHCILNKALQSVPILIVHLVFVTDGIDRLEDSSVHFESVVALATFD